MNLILARSNDCPICRSKGTPHVEYENQTLYRCSGCRSLYYSPYPAEGWPQAYEALESCPFYIERGADLLFYSHIVNCAAEVAAAGGTAVAGTPLKVLEVGCSYGFLIDIARELHGWEVAGVDPSPCAALGAAELGLGIDQAPVEQMSGKNIYDLIISVESIEHVGNPREHLHVMAGLLGEDGFLLLTTPDAERGDLGPYIQPGEHYVIFSQSGLARLLRDAGLTHFSFFRIGISEIVAVVAARKPLPSGVPTLCNSDGLDRVGAATVDYLRSKIAVVSPEGLLSRGLHFRLFELLVNQGRYAEAAAIDETIDRLLGFDGDNDRWSLIEPLVQTMEAAEDSNTYLRAGPACLAPYLFYKGMLTLNHKKDASEAAKFFGGAARLFRKEVNDFDFTHFRTFLIAAESHEDLAALAAGRTLPIRPGPIREGSPRSSAAPWFRNGVTEFALHVSASPMEICRIPGGSSVVFGALCCEDNLSAFALNPAPIAKKKGEPISLTLTVSDRNDSSVLRSAVTQLEPVLNEGNPSLRRGAFEVFVFDPIVESRGRQLTLRLDVPPEVAHLNVLCRSTERRGTRAAGTAVGNITPVAVPYFATWESSKKSSPNTAWEPISVLIATRNDAGSIGRTLDSIMEQDYPVLEIIVVDRNSGDGTKDLIARAYPQIRLLQLNEKVRVNRAYNIGMGEAKGDVVLVMGEGAIAERTAVSRLMRIMSISKDIGLVGWMPAGDGSRSDNGNVFFVDGRLVASEPLLPRERFMAGPSAHGFLVRRRVADDLGHLFDEKLPMKWASRELGLRCWLQGLACVHVPLSCIESRPIGESEETSNRGRASQVCAELALAFRTFGRRSFARTALKILAETPSLTFIGGFARFLSSLGEHRMTGRMLQERRRVSDTHLKILGGGIPSRIPRTDVEEQ